MRSADKFSTFHFPGTGEFSTKAMSSNEWNGVPIMVQHLQANPIINTGAVQGSITAVCATSEHPDLAVKYIKEVNTNPDLLNLLNYGIKGKHWVWVDKDKKLIAIPKVLTARQWGTTPTRTGSLATGITST